MRIMVNGRSHDINPPATATLLDVLRDQLELTGTKLVCDQGECGACAVLIDGDLAYSCLTLAAGCAGGHVMTVEGLATTGGRPSLSPLQRAFIAYDAAQCGFCTPGQLMAAHALLQGNPSPGDDEIREHMSGNLCRCGTYPKVARAIRAVADGEFAQRGGDGA